MIYFRSLNEEVTSLKDTKTLLENDLDEMELLLNAEQKVKFTACTSHVNFTH